MGAFVFLLIAKFFRRESLSQTARHCIVLALISLLPTAVLGYADWQYRFGGAWIFPITMKLILAGVLLIILVIAIVMGFRSETSSKHIVTVYAVCLVVVIGIGYFGGELVYGKKAPAGKIEVGLAREGAALFNQRCAVCHHSDKKDYKIGPGLQGLFQQEKLPVSGRPITEANVRSQLQTPFRNMPAFPELSEEKLEAVIAYLKTL